jgi:hypothetical protein
MYGGPTAHRGGWFSWFLSWTGPRRANIIARLRSSHSLLRLMFHNQGNWTEVVADAAALPERTAHNLSRMQRPRLLTVHSGHRIRLTSTRSRTPMPNSNRACAKPQPGLSRHSKVRSPTPSKPLRQTNAPTTSAPQDMVQTDRKLRSL